jgi:hypothetical protein
MVRRASTRESIVRIAFALAAVQIGAIVGRLSVDDWQAQWYMLIPLGFIGLLIGAAITPMALLPLCALVVGTCGYVLFAISRWWCLLLSGLSAVVVAIVTETWRTY